MVFTLFIVYYQRCLYIAWSFMFFISYKMYQNCAHVSSVALHPFIGRGEATFKTRNLGPIAHGLPDEQGNLRCRENILSQREFGR